MSREYLVGKIGINSRAWKGESAGYVAKHLWIVKHYGNATQCSVDTEHVARRFEWHNISGEYKRDMSDWTQLCPSYHRKLHKGNHCKHGHEFTKKNTRICKNGWRHCRACHRRTSKKWRIAQ